MASIFNFSEGSDFLAASKVFFVKAPHDFIIPENTKYKLCNDTLGNP